MASFETRLFINNEYVNAKSGEKLTVYNPVDDSLVSDKIDSAGEADVDAAVAAAQAAFKGDWGKKTDPTIRAKAMRKFADLIRAKAEEIASLDTKCMGSAVSMQTGGYHV
jgi:aldehyde dehydrogenase (NAD+)